MAVQNVKAASRCQMFGWVLRMLLSTRAIREYCLALWRQVPFKRHWMFLLSLKVKKPLIWSAVFFVFLFHFFFSLWLARAWEEFHGLVNSSGRWSNAPPPSVTRRVGPHLSSYVTSRHTSQLPTLFPWAGMFSSCLVGLMVGLSHYWLFPKGQNIFFSPPTKGTDIHSGLHSLSIFWYNAACCFANVSFLCASRLYPRPSPRRLRGTSSAWVCCLGLTGSGKWMLSTSLWWTPREAPGAWHTRLCSWQWAGAE